MADGCDALVLLTEWNGFQTFNMHMTQIVVKIIRKLKFRAFAGYRALRARSQLKIGPRLLVGFLTIIFLVGLIGFLTVQQLRGLSATTNELNTSDLPEVVGISNLHSLLDQQSNLEQLLVSENDPNRVGDMAALSSTLDRIESDRTILLSVDPSTAVKLLSSELLQSRANSMQILAFVRSNYFKEARFFFQSKQAPLLQTLFDKTGQLRNTEKIKVVKAAARLQQQSSRITLLTLGLTLFSILLSVGLALSITRSLTRPLSALLNATRAMSWGDYKADTPVAPGDELAQLAASFNAMFQNLSSTIAVLASERQQTQAVIDASPDGVMLVDAQGKILQFNPAAERLCGWFRSEAIGRYCCEVLGCQVSPPEKDEEHGRLCPVHLALQMQSDQTCSEVRVSTRTGQHRWYRLSSAPIPQAVGSIDPPRWVIGIHDITQLKAVEQLKSDFVAMVSHELRAPLTTVTASVETLELLDPIEEQEFYREVVCILSKQTYRLRKVVEEVLQFAQVDAGRLPVHLEPVPLVQTLNELLENMRSAWASDERPLSLSAPTSDIMVWADRAALEIVIRNLLDNAQKYTPPGSPVEVIVETAQSADHVQVRINDHGRGIPPEELKEIFQSFSRGTSSRNWTRGYGLGLYITREILHVHSGDIWAENRPDGGASFIFTLCTAVGEPPQVVEKAEEDYGL